MERSCGTCSMCCKILDVPLLNKPAHVWCQHARPGKGCGIWGSHPEICQVWQCGWKRSEELDERWKPDKCGFILSTEFEGRLIMVEVDPNRVDAWRKEPFNSQIRTWAADVRTGGRHVVVRTGRRVLAIFPEEELDLGELQPGEKAVMGYRQDAAYRQPTVRILKGDGVAREVHGRLVTN